MTLRRASWPFVISAIVNAALIPLNVGLLARSSWIAHEARASLDKSAENIELTQKNLDASRANQANALANYVRVQELLRRLEPSQSMDPGIFGTGEQGAGVFWVNSTTHAIGPVDNMNAIGPRK